MEKSKHILLIEDNPGDAFLIKFYLEESIFKDAELIHAEFMGTAIDLLTKNKIDVILLDLNLPDSHGIETLETVLAASRDSVVIVLTGLNDEDLGVQTVKLGAQDFLIKGQFDGKVLTSSIRYAFERYQLHKQVAGFTDRLDKSKQQFELAQKIGRFGYWELSLNDSQMYWSDELRELLNLPDTKAVELKHLLKAVADADHGHIETAFTQAIEGKADIDATFEGSKGGTFVIKSNVIRDSDDTITALAGIVSQK